LFSARPIFFSIWPGADLWTFFWRTFCFSCRAAFLKFDHSSLARKFALSIVGIVPSSPSPGFFAGLASWLKKIPALSAPSAFPLRHAHVLLPYALVFLPRSSPWPGLLQLAPPFPRLLPEFSGDFLAAPAYFSCVLSRRFPLQ